MADDPSITRSHTAAAGFGDLNVDASVPGRTYLKNGEYLAVTSLGAIRKGHTLVLPTIEAGQVTSAMSILDHVTRSGSRRDLDACVEAAKQRLTEFGPNFIMFEHGGLNSDYSSMCGTCFPHLHILPTGRDELDFGSAVIRACRFKCDYIRDYPSLTEFYRTSCGDGEYLMAADHTGVSVLWAGRHMTFPSQILRHAVQECLGLPRDFWQDHPRADSAAEIASSLRQA